MNLKKTVAAVGLVGIVGLGLGLTPAVADSGKSDKGNAVSQAAKVKEKGESNKEAAHANAPGQQKKVTPAPVVTTPAAPAPVESTPAPAPVETTTPAPEPVVITPTAPPTSAVEEPTPDSEPIFIP
jgi:hypothetical protein